MQIKWKKKQKSVLQHFVISFINFDNKSNLQKIYNWIVSNNFINIQYRVRVKLNVRKKFCRNCNRFFVL